MTSLIAFLFLCVHFAHSTTVDPRPLNGEVEKHSFRSLNASRLQTKRVPNELHCSLNCKRHDKCVSFNFAATNDSVGNFICELLGSRWTELPLQRFKINESFHHFNFKEFCSPSAIGPALLRSDNTYECPCKAGYTGLKCDIDIDECHSNPCVHGTCNDKINAYLCACEAGYTGKHCETDIDECASNPCVNGTCQNFVAKYQCDCVPGFQGTNCETEIDECASNPCQNGGQCTDKLNSFNCTCAAGFSGDKCETNIDECASNPCQNGGTCADSVNRYSCTCQPGFQGFNCENEFLACTLNPCKNGGVCENLPGGLFKCTCQSPTFGTTCRHTYVAVQNEIKSNPDAKADCNNLGKDLGTITDENANEFFKTMFSQNFWIGLKKNDGEWDWQGDSEASYRNWDSNIGSNRCTYVNHDTGKWATASCSDQKNYVCTSLNDN